MEQLEGFFAALQIGGVMVYPLFALTVLAVVIILEKAFVFTVRTRLPGGLVDLIWPKAGAASRQAVTGTSSLSMPLQPESICESFRFR